MPYGFRNRPSASFFDVLLCGDFFVMNDVLVQAMAQPMGQSIGNAAINERGTPTMVLILDEPAPNFRQPRTIV